MGKAARRIDKGYGWKATLRLSPTVTRIVLILAALIVTEGLCRWGYIKAITLIPPTQMAYKLSEIFWTEAFWADALPTLRNIVVAAMTSWISGVLIGVTLYALPKVRHAVEPLIASYYSVPFFAFYPLAVVILGMNAAPIIIMAALFAVVAMITSTLSGLDQIPSVLRKVGQSFRLGPIRTAVFIELQATMPYLFAGAKLSLGYSVAGVIGAEFILSDIGLGYAIAYSYGDFDSKRMYALMLFVIIFVILLLIVVNRLERALRYRAGASWTINTRRSAPDSHLPRWAEWAIVGVTALCLWQGLHWLSSSEALASPWVTAVKMVELLQSQRFWGHAGETWRALWLSLVLSCICGALLGIWLGMSRYSGEVVEPLIIALQSTPKVTLYPMMLLFFGLGLAAKVAFGVIHGIIPMTLITLHAIRSINPALLRTARALRLTAWQTFGTVCLPAAMPEMVTAARLSFSVTFLGVLIGEMFASQRGLGFLIMTSIGLNDVATIVAVTVMIGVFSVVVNSGLMLLDDRLHRRSSLPVDIVRGPRR